MGDIVLPDITPWPTREELFDEVADVIKPHYTKPNEIFGLNRYIKSLKKLGEIAAEHPKWYFSGTGQLFRAEGVSFNSPNRKHGLP